MPQILPALAAILLITAAQLLAASGAARSSAVSPLAVVGPRATPSAAAADASRGLFTCQVVGENADAVCYDPYQIRRAYHIEHLIRDGFDGGGKTVVIIDAFQSPNIVAQLNTFDSFFGLPGLNGLGGSYDRKLGTFKQIAPDGLTPFVPGNAEMTGWAGEISLDVLWAHAIAPGANIVLVLAKSFLAMNPSRLETTCKVTLDPVAFPSLNIGPPGFGRHRSASGGGNFHEHFARGSECAILVKATETTDA